MLEKILYKPSINWYRLGKVKIGYEQCYKNLKQSTYLAKARTNSLQLEDQLGRGIENYNKTCKMCKLENENLKEKRSNNYQYKHKPNTRSADSPHIV